MLLRFTRDAPQERPDKNLKPRSSRRYASQDDKTGAEAESKAKTRSLAALGMTAKNKSEILRAKNALRMTTPEASSG
jgi:hypothetical protein